MIDTASGDCLPIIHRISTDIQPTTRHLEHPKIDRQTAENRVLTKRQAPDWSADDLWSTDRRPSPDYTDRRLTISVICRLALDKRPMLACPTDFNVPRPTINKQLAALRTLYFESWRLQKCQRGCNIQQLRVRLRSMRSCFLR